MSTKHFIESLCFMFCVWSLGCPLGVEMCDMAKWWEIIRKVIE